jgi:hypothetical protein
MFGVWGGALDLGRTSDPNPLPAATAPDGRSLYVASDGSGGALAGPARPDEWHADSRGVP